MNKKTTAVKVGVTLGGLRTNADKLVALAAVGEITPPKLGPLPYRIQAKTGLAIPLPGTGSITFNKRIGDNCIDLVGDHIEPGVTMEYRGSSDGMLTANNGLNTLACIGNPVRVLTGDAKGEKGRVTGTHGGVEHVIVDFPSDVLEMLAIGDKMQVHTFGIGLELLDFPEVKIFNLDPQLLNVLEWKKDRAGKLVVPVTHFIPGKVMGSGLGNNHVWRGDYDIQMFDEKTVAEYNLTTLRFGDIVALLDVDNSYGRIWSEGSVTIGVVIHSNSVVAGHGPGVTTLATSLAGSIKPVLTESANLAYYFDKLKSKRKKSG